MQAVKFRIHIRKHGDPTPRRKANTELALLVLREIMDPVISILLKQQHFPCSLQINLPSFRRMPVRPRTMKKLHTEFLLKFKKLLVERRLRDIKLFRRTGDVVFFRDCYNILYLT